MPGIRDPLWILQPGPPKTWRIISVNTARPVVQSKLEASQVLSFLLSLCGSSWGLLKKQGGGGDNQAKSQGFWSAAGMSVTPISPEESLRCRI